MEQTCDLQDNWGNTALILAIEEQRQEIALKLIEKGANFYLQDNKGETALSYSIESNLHDISIKLIEKGAFLYSAPYRMTEEKDKQLTIVYMLLEIVFTHRKTIIRERLDKWFIPDLEKNNYRLSI